MSSFRMEFIAADNVVYAYPLVNVQKLAIIYQGF